MTSTPSENVSPTAYATGYFWVRHGLSHPALATPQGKKLDRGFRLLIATTQKVSGVSLEAMMLARHRGIDARLTQAIEEGRVGQVIELAAGLTGRGLRFVQSHGARLRYIETDLPAMAATKRRLLAAAGLETPNHRVVELDVLKDDGAESLAAVAGTLDPGVGTAIITEGLMNYLAPEDAQAVWRRIAGTLRRFPRGTYLADVYPRRQTHGMAMTAFGAVLSAFVRGRMHSHFQTPEEAVAAMRTAGFDNARVIETRDIPETRELASTPGAERVRVLEALTV
ncbi:MAG TPA: class I SAM-dependent methyltransferase [Solimonas sp.]|nr:class I SAM-dependent methyltransferase [Solimonas sp.]